MFCNIKEAGIGIYLGPSSQKTITLIHKLNKKIEDACNIANYTWGHTVGVTLKYIQLARKLGLNEEEILQGAKASLLHDIGKLIITPEILNKTEPLDEENILKVRTTATDGDEYIFSDFDNFIKR